MGVDYTAYAVIGCEVTGKLYRGVEVRSCKCRDESRSGRFCQECGRSTSPHKVTEKMPFYNDNGYQIGSLRVAGTADRRRHFAGFIVSTDCDDESAAGLILSSVDLTAIRDTVQRELEPHGLWSPGKFGLWAVIHVSY